MHFLACNFLMGKENKTTFGLHEIPNADFECLESEIEYFLKCIPFFKFLCVEKRIY